MSGPASWLQESVLLRPTEIVKRHSLPIAVRLHVPSVPLGLDPAQPLLLYSSYSTTKVRAVSLRHTERGLTNVGPSLVIPDSYSGWFSIMGKNGASASVYRTVQEVVEANLTFFLTRYDVPAYLQTSDECVNAKYKRIRIPSGHVLKLLRVFQDLRAPSMGEYESAFSSTKYAQCLNYKEEIVYLPFAAAGRFYATAHKGSRSHSQVYLISQIMKNFRFPLTVRLVCGYMPRVPCSFTGLLRLEKARKELVILGCTMTPEKDATLMEMDVNSEFSLAPVVDPDFKKSPLYLKTVSFCQDEGDSWRRQIKVTHHVTEKRPRSLTRSLSEKFFEPISASSRHLSFFFLTDFSPKRSKEKRHSEEISNNCFNELKDRQFRLTNVNTYITPINRAHMNTFSTFEKQIQRLSKSFDDLGPSRTVDFSPVSGVQEDRDDEDLYAEICEHLFMPKRESSSKSSNGGDMHRSNNYEIIEKLSPVLNETKADVHYSNSIDQKNFENADTSVSPCEDQNTGNSVSYDVDKQEPCLAKHCYESNIILKNDYICKPDKGQDRLIDSNDRATEHCTHNFTNSRCSTPSTDDSMSCLDACKKLFEETSVSVELNCDKKEKLLFVKRNDSDCTDFKEEKSSNPNNSFNQPGTANDCSVDENLVSIKQGNSDLGENLDNVCFLKEVEYSSGYNLNDCVNKNEHELPLDDLKFDKMNEEISPDVESEICDSGLYSVTESTSEAPYHKSSVIICNDLDSTRTSGNDFISNSLTDSFFEPTNIDIDSIKNNCCLENTNISLLSSRLSLNVNSDYSLDLSKDICSNMNSGAEINVETLTCSDISTKVNDKQTEDTRITEEKVVHAHDGVRESTLPESTVSSQNVYKEHKISMIVQSEVKPKTIFVSSNETETCKTSQFKVELQDNKILITVNENAGNEDVIMPSDDISENLIEKHIRATGGCKGAKSLTMKLSESKVYLIQIQGFEFSNNGLLNQGEQKRDCISLC